MFLFKKNLPNENGIFYAESFTPNITYLYQVKKSYYHGNTRFQRVDILELETLGKTLFLDGKLQSSFLDEYIYHEIIVHPAMLALPYPHKIFIAGGGEGATLREVLRHSTVEEVIMVDIDKELVELAKSYLPEWSYGNFTDKKVRLEFQDARTFLKNTQEKFDVVILDLTEPIAYGPSVKLFTYEFFQRIKELIRPEGIIVVQAGSAGPHDYDFFLAVKQTLEEIFPIVRPYTTYIFSFQSLWGFVLASCKYDPVKIKKQELKTRLKERNIEGLRFYYPELHGSLFTLPLYLKTKKGRIITDENTYLFET